MHVFSAYEQIRDVIQLARREDEGPGHVTSRLLVGEATIGVGTLLQKDVIDGRYSEATVMPLLRLRGPMRSLLLAERVILNFLQHMSGVATLTHKFARRVEGTIAKIFDTRKTIPGHRLLDKYAVLCG